MQLRKREETKATIPTASMADIAFLLILFFMVSTMFSTEMGLQIVLPKEGETVKVKKGNIAHIRVNAAGEVEIEDKPVEIDEVKERAEAMLAENDSLIFSLKTHPNCRYENMIRVFDQLKLARAERISFAPSKRKRR